MTAMKKLPDSLYHLVSLNSENLKMKVESFLSNFILLESNHLRKIILTL